MELLNVITQSKEHKCNKASSYRYSRNYLKFKYNNQSLSATINKLNIAPLEIQSIMITIKALEKEQPNILVKLSLFSFM